MVRLGSGKFFFATGFQACTHGHVACSVVMRLDACGDGEKSSNAGNCCTGSSVIAPLGPPVIIPLLPRVVEGPKWTRELIGQGHALVGGWISRVCRASLSSSFDTAAHDCDVTLGLASVSFVHAGRAYRIQPCSPQSLAERAQSFIHILAFLSRMRRVPHTVLAEGMTEVNAGLLDNGSISSNVIIYTI